MCDTFTGAHGERGGDADGGSRGVRRGVEHEAACREGARQGETNVCQPPAGENGLYFSLKNPFRTAAHFVFGLTSWIFCGIRFAVFKWLEFEPLFGWPWIATKKKTRT